MQLDHDSCYRLLTARDARFDGRFFVAVKTTGIYCRPICPARTPKPANVDFYTHAAAAEAAGFRPCLRCRPDTAPGSPAWHGASATVTRALKLIDDGALDHDSVSALAGRLGVGERQLRRLFRDWIGVGPLAVARTRRAHFARRLIDATTLPMAEVAEAAGYKSVRQFNDQIRETFHRSPSELRRELRRNGGGVVRGSGGGAVRANGGNGGGTARAKGSRAAQASGPGPRPLELELPCRAPFDWDGLVSFLRPRAVPGVEVVDGATYRRACRVGRETAIVEVLSSGTSVRLRYHGAAGPGLMRVTERARRLFDLDADPAQVSVCLGRDPVLAPLVARCPGRRVPGAWDPFEAAVRAIIGQQVTVAGATTLIGRLVHAFGEPVSAALMSPSGGAAESNVPTHVFPLPDALVEADIGPLGMPEKRAETIRTLARALHDGALTLDAAEGLDVAVEALDALPGIGPWTAQYIAMRALGEPDAFPVGDLGLRKAWAALTGRDRVTDAELAAAATVWRPWRAYAVMHLWDSLS